MGSIVKIDFRASQIGFTQTLDFTMGESLAEIAEFAEFDPDQVTAWVRNPDDALVEWSCVDRDKWHLVRPKPNGKGEEANFMFVYKLHGGGGASGIFAAILTVVLTVVSGPLGTALGTAIGVSAQLATALIYVAGSLLIGMLFQPEKPKALTDDDDSSSFSDVTTGSQTLAVDDFLPVIAGHRRFTPPDLMQPRLYIEEGVQTVERLIGMHGEHQIDLVEIDGTETDDITAITTQIEEGGPDDTIDTFIKKVSAYTSINSELSNFTTKDKVLESQSDLASSSPQPVRFSTPSTTRVEEVRVRMKLSTLTHSTTTDDVTLPLRVRIRPKGSGNAWINLPEIHITGRSSQPSIFEFVLRWDRTFAIRNGDSEFDVNFWQYVPDVTSRNTPVDSGWEAHSHFSDGTTNISQADKNIYHHRDGIDIDMDQSVLPIGRLEWEITRGEAFTVGFLNSSYTTAAGLASLFVSSFLNGSYESMVDQNTFYSTVSVQHAVTTADHLPCLLPETALVALKSKGQSFRTVQVSAWGKCLDWDGSAWVTEVTTKNPATWYYHFLSNFLTYHGFDLNLIDNASIVAWRQECIDKGYEVSMVVAGDAIEDILPTIAAAGYAKPVFYHGFGVDYFRDRSSERPVCSFTPRNTNSISIVSSQSDIPSSVRASFQDQASEYETREISINNPFPNDGGQEALEIRGLTSEELVRRRQVFDLLQRTYRDRFYNLSVDIEHIGCFVGDMVNVTHDFDTDYSIGARISQVTDPVTIVIDQVLQVSQSEDFFDVSNVFDIENVFSIKNDEGVVFFTTPDGTEMHSIHSINGCVIRLKTPIQNLDILEAHCLIGSVSDFTKRAFVQSITPSSDMTADIILIDEAPDINKKMEELGYG